jgi:predicted ATPase
VPTHFGPATRLRRPESQWNQGALATLQVEMCPRTANSGLPEGDERDRRELGLRVAAGLPLIAVKGHASPEVEATYERGLELAERLADGAALFAALRGLWNCVHDRGELERALALAERLVAVADERGDPGERALAWRALGSVRLGRGELDRALGALGRGLETCAALPADACLRVHGEAPGIICAQYAGWAHTLAGRPDTGLALARRALDEARRLGHPLSLAFAAASLGVLRALRREPDACRALVMQLSALSGEHGLTFWSAQGEILQGWARAQSGDPAGGAELLCRGLSDWRATGAELHVPTWSAFLAEALLDAARHAAAAAVLEAALGLAVAHQEHFAVAELHRLRGRLALAEGRPEESVAAFALALDAARGSGGRADGAARRDQPRPALARPGRARRGPRPPFAGVPLVHRGLRHARPEGSERAARRASMNAVATRSATRGAVPSAS